MQMSSRCRRAAAHAPELGAIGSVCLVPDALWGLYVWGMCSVSGILPSQEVDVGCARSGGVDTGVAIAQALQARRCMPGTATLSLHAAELRFPV